MPKDKEEQIFNGHLLAICDIVLETESADAVRILYILKKYAQDMNFTSSVTSINETAGKIIQQRGY